MALSNIIRPSQQVQDSQGAPLGGGSVHLFDPGTTNFITTFRDSSLVVPNTAPVPLSGSGRANIWITRDCDMFIYDRNGNLVLQELNANPDTIGEDSGGLVPNVSFEIDSDANNIPDGWTLVNEAGSNNGIDITKSTDGAQSFRFTSSGVGGGSLTTTDFFPVNGVDPLRVNFDIQASILGPRNIVRVEWYDATFVTISNSNVLDSTSVPAGVWTEFQTSAVPPGTARFAKLRLIGIDPSVAFAASTWFDRINVFYPALVAGVFDNITIQNNEIVSTNLNGAVNIIPNGTGLFQAFYNSTIALRTNTDGVDVVDPVGAAPRIRLLSDAFVSRAGFSVSAGGDLSIFDDVNSGNVNINGRNSGGTLHSLIIADPNAAISLYHNNLLRVATANEGLAVRSDANMTVETDNPGNGQLRLIDSDGSILAGQVGFLNTTELVVHNRTHGGAISLRTEDSSGNVRTMATLSPVGDVSTLHSSNGGWRFEHNANVKLQTFDSGVAVRSTSAAAEPPTANPGFGRIEFIGSTGVGRLADVGFLNDALKLYFLNRIHGGSVEIGTEDSAGNYEAGLLQAPDGAVTLYHAGISRLVTRIDGAEVSGTYSGVNAGADSTTQLMARNSVGGVSLHVNNTTALASLIQTSSLGGLEDSWVVMTRDAGVELYNDNVAELKSQAHAAAAITSGAAVKDFGGAYRDVGFNVMPPATFDAATTISRAHLSQVMRHDSGTHAYTTPASSDTDFPNGGLTTVINLGGTLTVAAGSGVTLSWLTGVGVTAGTPRTIAVGGIATVYRISSTSWLIWGSGIS